MKQSAQAATLMNRYIFDLKPYDINILMGAGGAAGRGKLHD